METKIFLVCYFNQEQERTPSWLVWRSKFPKSTLVPVQRGEKKTGRQCCREGCLATTSREWTRRARRSGRRRWRSPCLRSPPSSHLGSGSLQAPSPPVKSAISKFLENIFTSVCCHKTFVKCLLNICKIFVKYLQKKCKIPAQIFEKHLLNVCNFFVK